MTHDARKPPGPIFVPEDVFISPPAFYGQHSVASAWINPSPGSVLIILAQMALRAPHEVALQCVASHCYYQVKVSWNDSNWG